MIRQKASEQFYGDLAWLYDGRGCGRGSAGVMIIKPGRRLSRCAIE
jgi:hypothetical protein